MSVEQQTRTRSVSAPSKRRGRAVHYYWADDMNEARRLLGLPVHTVCGRKILFSPGGRTLTFVGGLMIENTKRHDCRQCIRYAEAKKAREEASC